MMLLLLFLSLLSFLSQNPSSAQCLQPQRSSLLTLFSPLHNLSWNSSTDCCRWDGVTCDLSSGHVISLDLTNRSINATLNSTALISLLSLQTLNLSLNLFNSPIPAEISRLTNLTHLNLSNSGFRDALPTDLSGLKRLQTLDLSSNFLSASTSLSLSSQDFAFLVGNLSGLMELDLDGVVISSPVPDSLGGLVNLTSLHLGLCNLTGVFPVKILQMPNLQNLDLSNNPLLAGTLPDFPENSSLRILALSGTNFSSVLPDSIGNLLSLQRLSLRGCKFSGRIPPSVVNIAGLVHLDISSNNFSGEIPPSVLNISGLIHLDISFNSFSGEIPLSLVNISGLVHLDISGNSFRGGIPPLGKLTQLIYLDLSSNNLSGQIPSMSSLKNVVQLSLSNNSFRGPIDSSFGNGLRNLARLELRNNLLNGKIPPSLFSLPSLKALVLSHNQFNSQLDKLSNPSSLLNTVDLSNNMLQGQIPPSVFRLVGLSVLTLSSNNFSGTIDLTVIENLKNLSSLDLSDNRLLVITNSTNKVSSFPQLGTLKLRSCNLTEFPAFLGNQSKLSNLDLSKNKINGQVPNWVWEIGKLSLIYLNLSYNELEGQLQIDLSLSKLATLDLHSNKLQGSIPFPPPSVIILDYSHNNFSVIPANFSYPSFTIFFSLSSNKISGEIPSSMCNMTDLQILDLSNNSFSGLIPDCLGTMSSLQVLNLGKNSLNSTIPQSFGNECDLRTLNLNGNRLEGGLPKSLANCKKLEVLNLGNNRINDNFPPWLGSLHQLRVLILRSNKLYGPIVQQEDSDAFQVLQIIDISSNGLTGNLPSECLKRWNKMMVDEDVAQSKLHHQTLRFGFLELNPLYYQETITVTIKGLDMEFLKILTIFTSMDLSNNRFKGIIPEEIGKLKSLYMLNISHNQFSGPIPSSLGNLQQLESLDLSANQLSGGIPVGLTNLTFVSVLNVSKNNLVGRIPQGFQFSTFSNDSFQDNSGLCGPPLTKKCDEVPESKSVNLQSKKQFNWQFIWIGLGFGGGIGMVFGPLVFWSKGRKWYNKHVDKMFFIFKPEETWSFIDCDGRKIEAEERVEQELMEFELDTEIDEEEQCSRHFCVFCTKIDVGWERVIHRECSCLDASPLFSYQGSQIAEKNN